MQAHHFRLTIRLKRYVLKRDCLFGSALNLWSVLYLSSLQNPTILRRCDSYEKNNRLLSMSERLSKTIPAPKEENNVPAQGTANKVNLFHN